MKINFSLTNSRAPAASTFSAFLRPKLDAFTDTAKPVPGSKIELGGKSIAALIQSLNDTTLKNMKVVDRAEILRLLSLDETIERSIRVSLLEKIYKDYDPDYESGSGIRLEAEAFTNEILKQIDLPMLLKNWPKEKNKQEKYIRQIHGIIAQCFGFKEIPVSITSDKSENGNDGGYYDMEKKTIKVQDTSSQDFGTAIFSIFHETIHHWQNLRLEKFTEKNDFKAKDKNHNRNLMLWAQNLPGNYIVASEGDAYDTNPDEIENDQISRYTLAQLGFRIEKRNA